MRPLYMETVLVIERHRPYFSTDAEMYMFFITATVLVFWLVRQFIITQIRKLV